MASQIWVWVSMADGAGVDMAEPGCGARAGQAVGAGADRMDRRLGIIT
jgi:hypothetical protein